MQQGAETTGAPGASRFQALYGESAGRPVITLRDRAAGSEAVLVPGLGFTCIAFRVPVEDAAGQRQWRVLAEPPDDDALRHRTFRYGIPILFPWPNRIRGGRFTFGVTEYHLPLSPDAMNASHGLAREHPWTVTAAGADDSAAVCRAWVELGTQPGDPWPFPARLTVEYRLAGRALTLAVLAENVGDSPMPMGFGLHPWFELPFGPSGSRDRCELRVPADAFWELESFIPTGRIRPVSEPLDARDWRPLEGLLLDDVYTRLRRVNGWFTAEVRDPASGLSVAVSSDAAFREHVVYAPLQRSTLCLEPYSCATDAFNLAARGIDAGVVVLGPGEAWSGQVRVEARAPARP